MKVHHIKLWRGSTTLDLHLNGNLRHAGFSSISLPPHPYNLQLTSGLAHSRRAPCIRSVGASPSILRLTPSWQMLIRCYQGNSLHPLYKKRTNEQKPLHWTRMPERRIATASSSAWVLAGLLWGNTAPPKGAAHLLCQNVDTVTVRDPERSAGPGITAFLPCLVITCCFPTPWEMGSELHRQNRWDPAPTLSPVSKHPWPTLVQLNCWLSSLGFPLPGAPGENHGTIINIPFLLQ